jgi:hypothetical protein
MLLDFEFIQEDLKIFSLMLSFEENDLLLTLFTSI